MICIADLEGTLTTGSIAAALERRRELLRQTRPAESSGRAMLSDGAELGEWIVENELWPKRTPLVELLRHRNAERVRVIVCSTTLAGVLEAFSRRLKAEALPLPAQTAPGLPAADAPGEQKAQQVRHYLRGERVDCAFSDSMEDLPLLDLAARPYAVNPDQELLAHARDRAWRVLHFGQVGAPVHGLIL